MIEPPPRTHLRHDGFLGVFAIDAARGWGALHFTVKRTFALEPATLMRPVSWQQVCFVADRYFEDAPPHLAGVQYESDFGPPKPVCDVVVDARCHPPGGKARRCDVAVKVGDHPAVELTVVGDRLAIIAPDERVAFTPAVDFDTRPIRYEWAYGGADSTAEVPFPSPANPIGVGYAMRRTGEKRRWRWVVLPNIEPAGRLMTPETFLADADPYRARPPAGFGWISRYWAPRMLESGMPAEAAGFWSMLFPDQDEANGISRTRKARFHQGAVPGLQLPIEGHELITLTHLHPEHPKLIVQLPIVEPRLRVRVGEDEPAAVKMSLSTVHLQVERDRATLCWRGTLSRPEADPEAPAPVAMKVDGRRLPPPETVTDLPFDPAAPPAVELGEPEPRPRR